MSYISEDISTDIFTSNLAVGSTSGGYDFGLVGNLQHHVKEITITLTKNRIARVVVKKQDLSCITIGGGESPESPLVTVKSWFFEPDEIFSCIQLFSKENCLSGIKLKTSKQDDLQACTCDNPPTCTCASPVVIPRGSGICVGVFGNAGTYVESLGFAMLKKRN